MRRWARSRRGAGLRAMPGFPPARLAVARPGTGFGATGLRRFAARLAGRFAALPAGLRFAGLADFRFAASFGFFAGCFFDARLRVTLFFLAERLFDRRAAAIGNSGFSGRLRPRD
jgi:hypothetical protein